MSSTNSNQASSNTNDHANDDGEIGFSLKETLEQLIQCKNDLLSQYEELSSEIENSDNLRTLPEFTKEYILNKRMQYLSLYNKNSKKHQLFEDPIPGSVDLVNNVIASLKNKNQELIEYVTIKENDNEIAEIKNAELRSKLAGIDQMKGAYLLASENEATETFESELKVAKEYFQSVKNDLGNVVDMLYPENEYFKDLFVDLTKAFMAGGDDVYIDVTQENFDFVNFLVEADIVSYHPHDAKKVKLINLL